MPSSVSLASRTWTIGTLQRTFDSPPAQSRGYSVAFGNRANWPAVDCLRVTIELSFDGGVTWRPESQNTFAGAVIGKGGVPIAAASVAGEWPSIRVNDAMVVQVPTDARITAQVLAQFVGPLNASWTT